MSFFNLFLTLVVLLSANGESSSKGETFIVSSFSYPHTRLTPFNLRYIRVGIGFDLTCFIFKV
ncbi:hypothetical protein MtrunA17_Chr2g0310481 [Medicago truncatula]|uniref:Transmembrane protein n=1 Tax=Medicago truncatula TaxID=3880 RepID=A0A396JDB3_MEDTR|nr:hypothetical protein MtrunA17_Chr2g0310481 [Medicago truncatula]